MRFSQPYSGRFCRYGFGLTHIFPKDAMTRLPLLHSFAALAMVCLTPGAALAYYPCNGPGPGEVLIGVDNSNGVQTPLCEYVGEDGGGDYGGSDYGGGGDPGGYWVDQYATLVWAQDGNGQPTYTWYINGTSQAEADSGAVAQCQASGFADCRIATGVVNGAIAIAVDNSGTLHADWGEDARKAKKKTLRVCKQYGGKGCKIEKVLESPAAWVSN
jgi:Domain of unknown function (DUF4189)